MLRRALPALLVLALAAACAGKPASDPGAPAGDGPDAAATPVEGSSEPDGGGAGAGLTVVTTVFPLADLARRVAPGADVRLLSSSGQDPHDLELSPGDRALLESADAVLYLGDIDFQPQVEQAVTTATGQVLAVTDVVDLRDLGGHADEEEHAGDDQHADQAARADDDAGNEPDEAVDPHVWFDAAAMAEVAAAIGDALAAAAQGEAAALRANAEALHDELLALDEEIDALLDGCQRDVAIVSHEAYAYLLAPRDLDQEGISGAGGHGEASPQRLAELTERLRAEGIPAVLVEPVEGRGDAEALAREAGVELIEIDPLEVGTDELQAAGYPEALRRQAEAFAEALGCA